MRGSSSRDGRLWVKGGVWILPAGSHVRVGLVSHWRAPGDAAATAHLDYLRIFHD